MGVFARARYVIVAWFAGYYRSAKSGANSSSSWPATQSKRITGSKEGYFDVQNLLGFSSLQWRILDDFEVSANDTAGSSNFVRVVVGVRLSDGVYVWSARFDQGGMRDYEA